MWSISRVESFVQRVGLAVRTTRTIRGTDERGIQGRAPQAPTVCPSRQSVYTRLQVTHGHATPRVPRSPAGTAQTLAMAAWRRLVMALVIAVVAMLAVICCNCFLASLLHLK